MLKLQSFGHLMQRADSFEKTLMLGKIEGRRRRGRQRMRCLDIFTDSMDMSFSKLWKMEGQGSLACCSPCSSKQSDTTEWLNNSNNIICHTGIHVSPWSWTHCVITSNLFFQNKRPLSTWTSPDGQYQNQIDYILCGWRWSSSIQLAKTRLGADCGSDHKQPVAKFRLILNEVGKTTRPFK